MRLEVVETQERIVICPISCTNKVRDEGIRGRNRGGCR